MGSSSKHRGAESMNNLTKETCTLYPMYKPCTDESCCDTEGYSAQDGPQQLCIADRIYIVTSLTAQRNCYDPIAGERMQPPTWKMESMDQHIQSLSGAYTIGANGNWYKDGVDTGKPSQGQDGEDAVAGDLEVLGSSLYQYRQDITLNTATNDGWNERNLAVLKEENNPVQVSANGSVFTAVRDTCLAVAISKEVSYPANTNVEIAKMYTLFRLAEFGVVTAEESRGSRYRTELVQKDVLSLNDASGYQTIHLKLKDGESFKVEANTYITADADAVSTSDTSAIDETLTVKITEVGCLNPK